ncbi:hypothetical protein DMC47_23000 [Nostoc sp. 3335mG]|nr:hypothetical protein DMC47_23000 [Nostoc sp. 3335mG]
MHSDRRFSSIKLLSVALLFSVAGCASLKPPGSIEGGTLISYETESGPFCGRCDSTKFSVGSDGRVWIEQGHWAGHYKQWTVYRRMVRVGPERADAFRRALEPYRPDGTLALNEQPPCKELWTDMGGISVSWIEGGKTSRLSYNFGCDPDVHAHMRAALAGAPATLGIKGLSSPVHNGPASTSM